MPRQQRASGAEPNRPQVGEDGRNAIRHWEHVIGRRDHALPAVKTIQFPGKADELPRFIDDLSALFDMQELTAEDADRTEMYRSRLAGLAPQEAKGADLNAFLSSLTMKFPQVVDSFGCVYVAQSTQCFLL